jgi:hypothetical protein
MGRTKRRQEDRDNRRESSRDAIEQEVVEATRSVLRAMGRIGELTGNKAAATAAEVLIGLVEGAVQQSRERETAAREEHATSDVYWLPPPTVDP